MSSDHTQSTVVRPFDQVQKRDMRHHLGLRKRKWLQICLSWHNSN